MIACICMVTIINSNNREKIKKKRHFMELRKESFPPFLLTSVSFKLFHRDSIIAEMKRVLFSDEAQGCLSGFLN